MKPEVSVIRGLSCHSTTLKYGWGDGRVEGAVSERPETSPVGHICNLERHLAEKIRI